MEDYKIVFDALVPHAPFIGVAVVLAYIGNFMSARVFTRERAYAKQLSHAWRRFFWYSRETLAAHPIIAGMFLGLVWRAPYGEKLAIYESATYFAAAGVCGMLGWTAIKITAKQRGIELTNPWSENPPAVTPDDDEPTQRFTRPPSLPPLGAEAKAMLIDAKLNKSKRGTSP